MLDFDTAVIAASHARPVLVDFYSPRCPHCRELLTALESAVASRGVTLVAVAVEEEAALAAQHGVRYAPALRLWRHGCEAARLGGADSRPEDRPRLASADGDARGRRRAGLSLRR
jgi:putative thioredoxin